MEKHFMKTQYCQDFSSPQLDLQIQCGPNKIPASYFIDIGKMIPEFLWRGKRQKSQYNTEVE